MFIFAYKDSESGEVTARIAGSLEDFQEIFLLGHPDAEVPTPIACEEIEDSTWEQLMISVNCLVVKGEPYRSDARGILSATQRLIIDAYLKGRKHVASGTGGRASILEGIMEQSGPGYSESGRCLQCGAAKEKDSF